MLSVAPTAFLSPTHLDQEMIRKTPCIHKQRSQEDLENIGSILVNAWVYYEV